MSEVLSWLQQRLHQGAANAGVAVSIDSIGEPRARHADFLAVLPLDHAVVSVAPFLHCQHRFLVSTDVLAEERCEAVGRLSVIPVAQLPRGPGSALKLSILWIVSRFVNDVGHGPQHLGAGVVVGSVGLLPVLDQILHVVEATVEELVGLFSSHGVRNGPEGRLLRL